MADDWENAESWFSRLDRLDAWRPLVAAMRRLITAIRADPRFHDLEPSTSHASLVFHRGTERAVMVSWNDDGAWEVASIGRQFVLRDRQRVVDDRVLEVLVGYLQR